MAEQYERVNHPAHYGGDTTYETIKVIEAWGLDKDFCLATAVRYLSRAGKKPGEELLDDLKKAAWYLNRRIVNLENERLNSESNRVGLHTAPVLPDGPRSPSDRDRCQPRSEV